jgi:hypothetical protein
VELDKTQRQEGGTHMNSIDKEVGDTAGTNPSSAATPTIADGKL